MDDLTLLRELDADVAPLNPRARLAARARLEREIEGPAPRRRTCRSRRRPRVGWLVAAAAVVGTAIAVAGDTSTDGGGAALTELTGTQPAANVLRLAAEGRDDLPPAPAVRRDQHLYVREVTEASPVDAGGRPRTIVEEEWRPFEAGALSRTCELGRCWTEQGGQLMTTEELAQIPRAPRDLLLYARAWGLPSPPTGSFTDDDWTDVYHFLFSLLRTPRVVPPDLRSALIEALAYTPDARLLDTELEFRGRPAAVIHTPSYAPGTAIDDYLPDIIVDRHTHEYLGSRWELGPSDMQSARNRRLFGSQNVRLVSYPADVAIVDALGERPEQDSNLRPTP
jgi:hypothetical protein